MVQLTNRVKEKYVFVKNGVIFKILTDSNNRDECAVKLTPENVPHIIVNDQEMYLDSLIEVGDVYSEESGFKKSVHCQGDETEMTFQEYYHDICEERLASMIASRALYYETNKGFKEYLKWIKDFPLYMIKSMGYNVDEIDQIDLTDEKYNQLKVDEVKKMVLEAAQNMAHKYGYEVTTQSIDIVEEPTE